LTIYEPAQNSLIDQDSVVVRGKSYANAVVAVVAEEEEYLINADENGEFSQKVDLIGGVNKINVKAVGSDGQESSHALNLVYSTAEIN